MDEFLSKAYRCKLLLRSVFPINEYHTIFSSEHFIYILKELMCYTQALHKLNETLKLLKTTLLQWICKCLTVFHVTKNP